MLTLTGKTGKILLYILKLSITGFILWKVFSRISLPEVFRSMATLPVWLVLGLLTGSFLRHWAQLRNWRHALLINPGYDVNHKDILRSYLIGLPLRFLVPGGPASVAKVLWVQNTSRKASIFSFGAERAFMTWATWTFATGAALFHYHTAISWLLWLLAIVVVPSPLWIWMLMSIRAKDRSLKISYGAHAPQMALLQVFASLLCFLQYWLLLTRFAPVTFFGTVKLMGLTNFSNSIPITVAGLGLRESFAVHFLDNVGITATQAVSATLALFVVQDILPALIGTGVMIANKHKR
jgi:hypothetical protein